jgi:hypothetical protein
LPAGSLSPASELSGSQEVSGSASDGGSGVAKWQLQIAPEGSAAWTDACPEQTDPVVSHTYGCAVETSAYANGAYQLRAVITDAAGNSYTTAVADTTIDNTPPAETSPPTVSGTPEDEQTLTAVVGTWTGTTPLTYSYQWQRCDGEGESCADVSGATASTLGLTHGDVGSTFRVRVTATNVEGTASSTSAAGAPVSASAPANTSSPVVTGIAQEGQTLGASAGAWHGTPPLSYAYQWQSCDEAGESCADISGATEASVVPQSSSVGHTVRVVVTSSNAAGSSSSRSAPTAMVLDASPLNHAAPSITGSAVVGATLTAAPGSWSGAEPITYSYQWLACNITGASCAPIEGATASTYAPLATDVGRTLEVEETAVNDHGSAAKTSTASTVVQGSAAGSACTDTWTGDAGDGEWGSAGNWITGKTPEPGDHVCILVDTTVSVTGGGQQAGWITDEEGTLAIGSRASLSIDGPSHSTLHDLTIEGGQLTGSGEVDVTGSFSGGQLGTLTGGVTVALEPGATGVAAQYWMTLDDATLINRSSFVVSKEGGIVGQNGARIINSGTLSVNSEDSASNEGLLASPGSATLTNTGTFEKAEGSGTTVVGFAIDNEGTVEAASGELLFTNGGSSGQFATDWWSSASGATIALDGFGHASYELGESAALSGRVSMAADVTAGTLNGYEGELVSEIGNLTLTGLETSVLASLTFTQPEPNYWNEQNLVITSELEVTEHVNWGSNDAFFMSGVLTTAEGSTTLFDPSAWIQIRGGQFINEGVATWTTGGFQSDDTGTFFINRGTFQANQDGGNPFVQGCEYEGGGEGICPSFENDGLFTADLPTEGWWPGQILWRVDLDNYGELDVPWEIKPECKWEYSEVPGPGTEACYREVREFKGLLLEEGAAEHGIDECNEREALSCVGEEEEGIGGEEGEALMYPDPEGGEEEETWGSFARQFSTAFDSASYGEKLCPSRYPCGSYKGASAASYAEAWALSGESDEEVLVNHNQDYNYYGGNGGDCTNFVSQALKAGGVRFMRAHGRNSPNGGGLANQEEDEAAFLKGQGSWWSYYTNIPLESSETYVHSYVPTESFVRAGKLYNHLLEYGLARKVKWHEVVRPGDIVFYDLGNTSLEANKIDHAQIVVKVSRTATWVAQHSPAYVHTLGYVTHRWAEGHGPVNVDWAYVILEPIHTAANIVG